MTPRNSLQKEQMFTGNKILFIFAPPPWRRDLLSLSEIVFWMMNEWGSSVNGKYCISWWHSEVHMMIAMVHFGFGDLGKTLSSCPVLSSVEHVFPYCGSQCIWIDFKRWWKKCNTKLLPNCPVLSYAELVFCLYLNLIISKDCILTMAIERNVIQNYCYTVQCCLMQSLFFRRWPWLIAIRSPAHKV